jgi:hypothetical protein
LTSTGLLMEGQTSLPHAPAIQLDVLVADAALCRSRVPFRNLESASPVLRTSDSIGDRRSCSGRALCCSPYGGKLPPPEWCEGVEISANTGPDIPLKGPLRALLSKIADSEELDSSQRIIVHQTDSTALTPHLLGQQGAQQIQTFPNRVIDPTCLFRRSEMFMSPKFNRADSHNHRLGQECTQRYLRRRKILLQQERPRAAIRL